MEDLIDEIDVVSGGQQDGLHHVVDGSMFLLNATQTGVTAPAIGQRAAVWVTLVLIHRTVGFRVGALLLTDTARSHSLITQHRQTHLGYFQQYTKQYISKKYNAGPISRCFPQSCCFSPGWVWEAPLLHSSSCSCLSSHTSSPGRSSRATWWRPLEEPGTGPWCSTCSRCYASRGRRGALVCEWEDLNQTDNNI